MTDYYKERSEAYLAAGRSGQYIVGVHGAQLVPAPVPARLALDADDLVDALQTVHTDGVQVHQATCWDTVHLQSVASVR